MQLIVNQVTREIICTAFAQGTKHDFNLLKQSKIAINEETELLADKGYQGIKKYHKNSKTPYKKTKKTSFASHNSYGNNTNFIQKLENKTLKYLAGVAKNRKVTITNSEGEEIEIRLDELAKSLPFEKWKPVKLSLDKPKTVWVTTFTAKISQLKGEKSFAIVMSASSFEEATDIDYFMTNVSPNIVTEEWVVNTYSQRNWVEVFYREALVLVRIKGIPSPRKT